MIRFLKIVAILTFLGLACLAFLLYQDRQNTETQSTGEQSRDGFIVSPVVPFDAKKPTNMTETDDSLRYSFISEKNPDVSMNVLVQRGGLEDVPSTEQEQVYRGTTVFMGFSSEEVVGTTYFEKEGFGYLIQTFGIVDGEKAAKEMQQVIDGLLQQMKVKE